MEGTVYVTGWSAWSPGLHSADDWRSWARGERQLSATADNPPLEHVDALFKRRFSQLTRMTIAVGHEALAGESPMKLAFASTYGEISQQYKITGKLIDENEVSPANFSLSVFNTPIAALSITEKNTEGYVALYPGKDCFRMGFIESTAALLSGGEKKRLLIVADELLPEPYAMLEGASMPPYALALVLSSEGLGVPVPADPARLAGWENASGEDAMVPAALRFLKRAILAAEASR